MWDCIVVGGGAAGLSAALVLGRARRRTLVVDAGGQSNLPVHAIGGMLGQGGRSPAQFYAAGHAELAELPSVEVRRGDVRDAARQGEGFSLTMADGRAEAARRVLIATGVDYAPVDLPGIGPLWGGAVFHCPFCHGWEAHGRPWGVLAPAPGLVHLALLATMWSDDVVAFTGGAGPALEPEDAARLAAAGVRVDTRPVAGVEADGERLRAVRLAGGEPVERAALLVGSTLTARSGLAVRLGAAVTAADARPGAAVVVDAMQRTDVPGLFAAGDVAGAMQAVSAAVASGGAAGAFVVHSLMAEAHGLPG